MKNSMFKDIRIAPPMLQSRPLVQSDALNTAVFWNSCCGCCCNVHTLVCCYPCYRPCVPSGAVDLLDMAIPIAKDVVAVFKEYNQQHPAQPISLESLARKVLYASDVQAMGNILQDVLAVYADTKKSSANVISHILQIWQGYNPAERQHLVDQVKSMISHTS